MSTEASAAYTTDLRIFVGLDESIASLVAWLTTSLAAGEPWPPVREALTRRFALSFDDARTCVDRLQGGVVRANTEDEGNQPDLTLDPVAWHSYQLARGGTFPTPPRGSAAWHGLIELLGHDLPGALAASSAFADAADPDEQRATQVWRGVLTGQPVARSALGAMATWRLHGLLEATLGANPTLPLQQRGDLAVALAMALSAEADELLEVAPTPGTAAWAGAASLHEVARRLEQVFDELGAPALARQATYLRGQLAFRVLRTCPVRNIDALLATARRDAAEGEREAAVRITHHLIDHVRPVLDEVEGRDGQLDDEPRLMLEALRDALVLLTELETGAAPVDLAGRVAAALARPGE
jgi:hypothetical protein